MYAKIFEGDAASPTLTIGNDKEWGQKIENLGSKHQDCTVQNIVTDKQNKIITSPAYMLGETISEVAEGIEKAMKELIEMA
jgi:enhancing lycopene biosynthesis protein 2